MIEGVGRGEKWGSGDKVKEGKWDKKSGVHGEEG